MECCWLATARLRGAITGSSKTGLFHMQVYLFFLGLGKELMQRILPAHVHCQKAIIISIY